MSTNTILTSDSWLPLETQYDTGLKKDSLVENLRARIVVGDLKPGGRLPTRRELEKIFGVSAETVQRALERLSQDGFVFSEGRRGTFVSQNPPYLSQYALVFRHHPQDSHAREWTRFYSEICRQALEMHRADHPRIAVYTGVEAHVDNLNYRELLSLSRTQCLAGLIFVDGMDEFRGTSLMGNPAFPRFGIGRSDLAAAIEFDYMSFYMRALGELKARGRRRLAFISREWPNEHSQNFFMQMAAKRDFVIRPYWIQYVNAEFAATSANIAHLLMNPSASEKPDALIIDDDNLVQGAIAGLLAAGARIPDDIDVVAHCNYPHPVATPVAVQHLGYDVSALLRQALQSIDALREGRAVSPVTSMPALFEAEWKKAVERASFAPAVPPLSMAS